MWNRMVRRYNFQIFFFLLIFTCSICTAHVDDAATGPGVRWAIDARADDEWICATEASQTYYEHAALGPCIIYTYTHIYVYLYIWTRTHTHTHALSYTHTRTQAYTHLYAHTRTHARTVIYCNDVAAAYNVNVYPARDWALGMIILLCSNARHGHTVSLRPRAGANFFSFYYF